MMPQPIPVKFEQEWNSPEGRVFQPGDRRNCTPELANQLIAEKIAERLPTMLMKVSVDCTDGISRSLRAGAVAAIESNLAKRLFDKKHAVQATEAELAAWEKFLAEEAAAEKAAADAALEATVEKPKAEKPAPKADKPAEKPAAPVAK